MIFLLQSVKIRLEIGELAFLAHILGQNLVDLLEILLRVGCHYFLVEGLPLQSVQFDNILRYFFVGDQLLNKFMDEVFVRVAILEFLNGLGLPPAVLVAFL